MQWLSVLFAVFGISYGLRTVYQWGLGSFHDLVPNMVVRWHFVNCMPVIWDIFSIGAIVIMHHINFRPRKNADPIFSEDIYDLHPEEVDNLDHLIDPDSPHLNEYTTPTQSDGRKRENGGSTLQSDYCDSVDSNKAKMPLS